MLGPNYDCVVVYFTTVHTIKSKSAGIKIDLYISGLSRYCGNWVYLNESIRSVVKRYTSWKRL